MKDDQKWWRDDSVWLDLFNPALREDSSKAERAAKLLHCLLVDIENNPQGSMRALECLENGFRLAFSFTPTYRTCLILFQASLDNDFPRDLDSMERVVEAAKRVKVELKRGLVSRPKRSREDE